MLTDEDVVDECVGFLFAGHETTASTLTWALYELATHPAAQRRVAAEGDTVRLDGAALHDHADTLLGTVAVVEETLRLYPSGIGIVRIANRATEISGHPVRKGTDKRTRTVDRSARIGRSRRSRDGVAPENPWTLLVRTRRRSVVGRPPGHPESRSGEEFWFPTCDSGGFPGNGKRRVRVLGLDPRSTNDR